MEDITYLVASLAPSHALHGAFSEIEVTSGRRALCRCGADLTFSPFAIAQLLTLDTPAVPPPVIAPSKKEKVSDGS